MRIIEYAGNFARSLKDEGVGPFYVGGTLSLLIGAAEIAVTHRSSGTPFVITASLYSIGIRNAYRNRNP